MDLFILNKRQSDGKPPEISRLSQSPVIDRLKSFLPKMAAANAELDQQMQQSPEACNIENVSESDERVIEMNIAVFEREDVSSTSSDGSSEESSDDETSESVDSDVDSVPSEVQTGSQANQTARDSQLPRIKMPKTSGKRRSRPSVEVLHSSDSNAQDK